MIVLDTNVVSEVMKPSPARSVAEWMTRERPRDLFTTAVTEAEILLGIALLPAGRRKDALQAAAERILESISSIPGTDKRTGDREINQVHQ